MKKKKMGPNQCSARRVQPLKKKGLGGGMSRGLEEGGRGFVERKGKGVGVRGAVKENGTKRRTWALWGNLKSEKGA